MGAIVLGTGVALRLPHEDEVRALDRARRGGEFELEGHHSYKYAGLAPPSADEVDVVAQAFVHFTDGAADQRWGSYQHYGHVVPLRRDATLELLKLVDEVAGDLIEDLLSDMRIAGLGVSRWQFVSAPHRIELASDLEARLAPLRRG